MALQNRKPFHFLCICWIILSYLGIIIIKAKQNCKYCIWHFNNQGYNVLVTRKRKTEYNPFKFPFITLPSSDLYILSHPSMHRAPQVSPAGFCVCVGRTKRGKVCKNWGLFAFPAGKVAPRAGWGACARQQPVNGQHLQGRPSSVSGRGHWQLPPPGGSHARERLHFYILNLAPFDGARTAVV